MSPHALCDLCLREASIMASFKKGIKQFTFLTLDTFDRCANGGTVKQSLDNLVMSFHVSPPSFGRLLN